TAAGLALLRDLDRHPLNRPVVVFFGGADSIAFQASRNMFMALSDVPSIWRKELTKLDELSTPATEDDQVLKEVLDTTQEIDPVKQRSALDRIIQIIELDTAMQQDELFRLRKSEALSPGAPGQVELEKRQVQLNELRYQFLQKPKQLSGEMLELAKFYARRAHEKLKGSLAKEGLLQQYTNRRHEFQQRIDLYEWLAGALGRDKNPSERMNNSRLIELLVALDF